MSTPVGPGAGDGGPEEGADPRMSLDPALLRVEPGGQAQVTVRLLNPGRYVESYRLRVNGLPDGWWQVHPPEVPVYPGAEGQATVVLTPPPGVESPPDPLPFAVCAVSTRDPARQVAEEGDLEIGRVLDVQASVTPVTSSARWTGRHRVQVSNWGNGPATLRVRGRDADDRLGFLVRPELITVPVGGSATVTVRARPRRPFLRGSPVRLPFSVVGEPPAGSRMLGAPAAPPPPQPPGGPAVAPPGGFAVDGAVLQQPVLPRAAGRAVLLLLVALVAGAVVLAQSSTVQGARRPDVAPDPPGTVRVKGVSPTEVQVSWPPVGRATAYSVERVDRESHQVTGAPVEVAAPATSTAVDLGKPVGSACFQVRAVRGTLRGRSGVITCGKTLSDDLAAPADVKAVAAGPGKIKISWRPRAKAAHTVLNDGQPVGEAPVGARALTVEVPGGEVCLEVLAVSADGESSSKPVKAPCVQVAEAAGSGDAGPSPTGGGQGGGPAPGQPGGGGSGAGGLSPFVVQLCRETSAADPGAKALLEPCRKALVQAGVEPVLLQMPEVNPTLSYFVSGFTSREQAEAFCTDPASPFEECQAWESAGLTPVK